MKSETWQNAELACFNDLAGLNAAGAYAQALVAGLGNGAYRAQVHIPAATAHVVSVADLISKLRTFAADFTNLCHDR